MTPYEILDDIGRCGYSFLQLNDGSIRCATVGSETNPIVAWLVSRRYVHRDMMNGRPWPYGSFYILAEVVHDWHIASQLARAFGPERFTCGNPYRERVMRLLK